MDDFEDSKHRLIAGHIIQESNANVPGCQEPGCRHSALKCTIPGGLDLRTNKPYDETYEYYCGEHAPKHGFCSACGTFIAGYKDFSSLCDNCEEELRDDNDDIDYDEYL